MKKRTFYATFLLFLTAIYTSILSLSVITLKGTMQQARQQCLNEQYFIASALYRDMAALEDRGLASQEELDSLMQPYLYLAGNRRSALFVYRDNTLLYTTGDSGNMETAPPGNQGEDRTVAIGQKGQKTLCSTWGALPRPYDSFQILYQIDITEHLDAWEERNNTMLFVGAALSFVMALSLLILLERLFLPLSQITGLSQKIADGDYRDRLPVHDGDEIGQMARSFNHMAEEIESKVTELAAAAENKQRFVDNFAHELRTPLAAISGYCELYSMGGVPPERFEEVMGRIGSESARMATLVEDLLTLARLDEGRPLDITEIDLVKLADNAVFDLQALDPTRTVGLTGISGRTPPMTLIVPADRDRISQVFTNLIGNIVRYTPDGSPVEIALGRSGDTAIVELRDHGPGIDETDRGRVFERFYRADTSRNRRSGGSGLGLAIVSGILAAHRGNASLTKTKGGGLTVRIELPMT